MACSVKKATNARINDLDVYYHSKIKPIYASYPFILQVTTWKKYTGPVLVVKELLKTLDNDLDYIETHSNEPDVENEETNKPFQRTHIEDLGFMTGEPLRRCLNIIKKIVGEVRDTAGIPLELQKFITPECFSNKYRYPLDEEAGAKLSLIFKLSMRVKELDRVELIARRVIRFTREEAVYWLSRITTFGEQVNSWAVSGLRIMLAGESQDRAIPEVLNKLRELD